MDILDSTLLNIDEDCYFIAASVDKPFMYTRFRGTISKRQIANDSISYFVKISEVLESKEYIKKYMHRHTFRMWHLLASRGVLKKLSCFDLTLNMTTFNQNFSKRYSKVLVPLQSVFVFSTEADMKHYFDKSISIMHAHLRASIDELNDRIALM